MATRKLGARRPQVSRGHFSQERRQGKDNLHLTYMESIIEKGLEEPVTSNLLLNSALKQTSKIKAWSKYNTCTLRMAAWLKHYSKINCSQRGLLCRRMGSSNPKCSQISPIRVTSCLKFFFQLSYQISVWIMVRSLRSHDGYAEGNVD